MFDGKNPNNNHFEGLDSLYVYLPITQTTDSSKFNP